jgi:DnaJ-like protein
MIEAYPLSWPLAQPRTPGYRRRDARFQITFGRTRDELLRELDLLHARNVIISSGMSLRRDGLPYADAREPDDPGVAVYFDRRSRTEAWTPYVIACDSYRKMVWNMRAIGKTVEALRTIQRHGATSLLEQAFQGFAALPPAGHVKPWRGVLGVPESATAREIRDAFLELCKIHHPDREGGSHERMKEINEAFAQARAEGLVT